VYSLSRSTPAPVSRLGWSPTNRRAANCFFALEKRQEGYVLAVELEKVEGAIGEPFTGLLHQFEQGHTVGLAVDEVPTTGSNSRMFCVPLFDPTSKLVLVLERQNGEIADRILRLPGNIIFVRLADGIVIDPDFLGSRLPCGFAGLVRLLVQI
jgi:hypothetical protein